VTKWWNAKAIVNNMMFPTNSTLIRSGHVPVPFPSCRGRQVDGEFELVVWADEEEKTNSCCSLP